MAQAAHSWFVGGTEGPWDVCSMQAVAGDGLPAVSRLARLARLVEVPGPGAGWQIAGFASNLRYTSRDERGELQRRQEGLGRPWARRAALIPIRKSDAWWALAQDERLAIYRASQHTGIGMDYLPAIARKLYHSRDLGEPFDFLTWFEFAAEDEPAFDALLVRLRASVEWRHVTREVDIRLAWTG